MIKLVLILQLTVKLLSYKIGNTTSEEKSARTAFMKKIDYLKRRWAQYSIIMQQFLSFMQAEVFDVLYKGRERIRNKISFLRNRERGEKKAVPEEFEGILISVIQSLTGGQTVTRGEKKAISLNPKETVQDGVTRDKMAVASDVLADKINMPFC